MKCISFYTLHAVNICIYGFISQTCLPHLRRKTCREVAALEQLELPNLPEDEVRHVTFPEWPPWCLMFGANISFWMKVYTKLKQNKLFSVATFETWDGFDTSMVILHRLATDQSLLRKDDGFTHISSTISVEAGHWHAESHPVGYILTIPRFVWQTCFEKHMFYVCQRTPNKIS